MFFADYRDLLDLFLFPYLLLMMLTAYAWYNVFRPPKGERFTRLRKRALRRREMYRAVFLLLALGCTLALAAMVYELINRQGRR